jgi:hypothetical protein
VSVSERVILIALPPPWAAVREVFAARPFVRMSERSPITFCRPVAAATPLAAAVNTRFFVCPEFSNALNIPVNDSTRFPVAL